MELFQVGYRTRGDESRVLLIYTALSWWEFWIFCICWVIRVLYPDCVIYVKICVRGMWQCFIVFRRVFFCYVMQWVLRLLIILTEFLVIFHWSDAEIIGFWGTLALYQYFGHFTHYDAVFKVRRCLFNWLRGYKRKQWCFK